MAVAVLSQEDDAVFLVQSSGLYGEMAGLLPVCALEKGLTVRSTAQLYLLRRHPNPL